MFTFKNRVQTQSRLRSFSAICLSKLSPPSGNLERQLDLHEARHICPRATVASLSSYSFSLRDARAWEAKEQQ